MKKKLFILIVILVLGVSSVTVFCDDGVETNGVNSTTSSDNSINTIQFGKSVNSNQKNAEAAAIGSSIVGQTASPTGNPSHPHSSGNMSHP